MGIEPVGVLIAAFGAVVLGSLALSGAMRTWGSRWRTRFGEDLGVGLRQSFVFLDVGRLFRLNLVVLAVGGTLAIAVTGRPMLAFAVVAGLGTVPGVVLAVLRRRRLARFAAQLPDAILLLAGALRAGSSLAQGLAQAARELPAPAGREFDLVVREQRLGVALDAAMGNLERRIPTEAVILLAAAVRIAHETGGNLAETLERLAETLRRKAAVEGRIDALTAQGRLQGWVMAALPLAVGAALFAIEPDAMRPLLATWQGALVCVLVFVLEALGLHAIRRIVAIDV
jgi:tight adherence protein B